MKKNVLIMLTSLFFVQAAFVLSFTGNIDTALAQEDWKQEYAAVCAKTQNAMALSPEEIQNYIDRCNTLQGRIEQLDDSHATEKKVYLKRLKMCRDMYIFALEFKSKE